MKLIHRCQIRRRKLLLVEPVALHRAKDRFVQLFFFSSRRRHTSLNCDWSSDVCSSDLVTIPRLSWWDESEAKNEVQTAYQVLVASSEERRVGKECRSRWSPYQ